MTVLELEGEGEDWRLHLGGDWSLAGLAHIEAALRSIPGGLHGTMVCDWSRAEHPGIGAAWALLLHLTGPGPGAAPLAIGHTGDPPHFLELLQKLQSGERPPPEPPRAEVGLQGPVGKVGRWAVLQGSEARAVIGFFGRIVTVLGEFFSRPRALRRRRWQGTFTKPELPPSRSCH